MDKQKIIKDLNYIMLEKRYEGKLRRYDSFFKKLIMYGPIALILGGGMGYPFGIVMMFIYRYATDKCRKACGSDRVCYNKCYYIQCKQVVETIKKDLKNLKKIEDPKKRLKIEKKLKKELKTWEIRMRNAKDNVID